MTTPFQNHLYGPVFLLAETISMSEQNERSQSGSPFVETVSLTINTSNKLGVISMVDPFDCQFEVTEYGESVLDTRHGP